MLPAPTAVVATARTAREFKPWWFGYWAATLLLVVAVVGGIVWGAASSPFAFRRFLRDETDSTRSLRSDTYVIYEEYPGAATPSLPSPVLVQVREVAGTDVRVTMLQEPGELTEVPAYRDPWHEGRAIATFTVTRAGPYRIRITPMREGSFDAARFAPEAVGTLAIGRQVGTTWLNSTLALLPLFAVPAAGGVALLMLTRRRRRAVAAVPATSVADRPTR